MEDLDFTRPAKSEVYRPDIARKFFESAGKPETAAQGGVIFSENQQGGKMYYLLEGEIGLARGGKTLDIVKAGEIFGEMALVDQSPRAASATAETDCYLLTVNRNDFLALVKSRPEFGVTLLKSVAERMRHLTAH